MYFIINETGERKELHYIDTKTGGDRINDVIGNSGAIGDYIIYDDEAEAYRISLADYEWWAEYIAAHAQEGADESKYTIGAEYYYNGHIDMYCVVGTTISMGDLDELKSLWKSPDLLTEIPIPDYVTGYDYDAPTW